MNADVTLVDLLARSADRHPTREAVIAGAERQTYAELWAAVQRGASRLIECGLDPGDRVALLASATPTSVAAYYAVLAAGGVVVPLDPDATSYELSTRLVHSDPLLVVAPASDRGRSFQDACARRVPVVDLDALSDGPAHRRALEPPSPDDPAAILYTSGTTDQPKGVMLTHRNLSANTQGIVDYLDLTSEDRVLSPLPLFYAYGSSVLHTHLAVGAAVVLCDLVYAERTVERMAGERVTGFSGVPWMFATLMDRTSFPSRPLPSLRYLTQAGARMSPAEIARVARARPGVAFFVMYGQTEATSRLTFLPPAETLRRPESVGRPIAGVHLEVRRADGSRAAPGEPGEVVARGPAIMAGYWRAPAATRATITNNERGRWLHTGDRGYLDAEGYLYLDGRLSDIIKVGAHRVSPAEVEDVARLHPDVAHVAAVAAPDPLLGQVVHLVVVRAPGATCRAADLVAHCRAYLSAYKTPRHVTFTDALPRTSSGKVQRARLTRALEAQP